MAVLRCAMASIWRLFILFIYFFQQLWAIHVMKTPLLLPDVRPRTNDLYVCYRMKLDHINSHYIVEYEPKASKNTAHHMLLYGCEHPGSETKVWNCGEMSADAQMVTAPVCSTGSKILYAWALDAPKLQLPEGVGFKVGGNTDIKYLVLQVHFADVSKFNDGSTDNSGIIFTHTVEPMPKLAGVYLVLTGGSIPPHKSENFEAACKIDEDTEMHPFAFRTHTHKLGLVVSGYVIQNEVWKLIGKRNPQTPQMFYPVVDDSLVIKKGDTVAARCFMNNDRDVKTSIGGTREDEMCNFYLMYWVQNPHTLIKNPTCYSPGPPFYYWSKELKNIPPDASQLPKGEDQLTNHHH